LENADETVIVGLLSGSLDPSIDYPKVEDDLSKKGIKFTGILCHVRLCTPDVVILEGRPSWLEVSPATGFVQ
jgi:hypothetical protein